jgi:hypothetical protein
MSIIFMIVLLIVFGYWAYTTYAERGNQFYTFHGLISLLLMIAFILSGAFSKYRKKLGFAVHTQAALFGFLLYTLVIFLGLLIAWGSV